MTRPASASAGRSDAGFTLIEAMVAMVVLLVGVASVANLMLVAASSNTVANQATGAATLASREIERLAAIRFADLATGGDLESDVADFNREDDIPGVGSFHTRWQISGTASANVLLIRVRTEARGVLTGPRSRAEFTTLRGCSVAAGC